MKKIILSALLLLQFLYCAPVFSAPTDGALLRKNFEQSKTGKWFKNDVNIISKDGNKVVKVTYRPSKSGTPPKAKKFKLNSTVKSATLSFDMMFHPDFEFVRGGKLHGLGGGSRTTGCKPVDPSGWSVRMMWRPEGRPVLYLYDQDRQSRCGDDIDAFTDIRFQKGKWYRIEMFVQLNSAPNTSDGIVKLFIDGQLHIQKDHIRLVGNSNVGIDSFMFNTFYGGNDPIWSPSKNTHAYFDNFTVKRNQSIAGSAGSQCEVELDGIYNPEHRACCSNSCGSCGGSGCGGLPGGANQCCTSKVVNNNRQCGNSGTGAPCSF